MQVTGDKNEMTSQTCGPIISPPPPPHSLYYFVSASLQDHSHIWETWSSIFLSQQKKDSSCSQNHSPSLMEWVKPVLKSQLVTWPEYNTKQSDDEASVLELWEMWSTTSLPLIPSSIWPQVGALDKVLSIGQIELFDI